MPTNAVHARLSNMIQIVLGYTFHTSNTCHLKTYWLAPPFSIHCLGAHVLSIEGKSAAAAGSNNVLQEGLGPGQGGDGLGDHVPDVQLVDHVQTQYQGRSFNTIHNNQSSFISLCRLWIIYSTTYKGAF